MNWGRLSSLSGLQYYLAGLELDVVLPANLLIVLFLLDEQVDFHRTDISRVSGPLWRGTLSRGPAASWQGGGMREERR